MDDNDNYQDDMHHHNDPSIQESAPALLSTLPPAIQALDLNQWDLGMVMWLMETDRHSWIDAFLAIVSVPDNALASLSLEDLESIFERLSPSIDGNDLAGLFGSFNL